MKAKEGSSIIVHPDFTMFNKRTGRIYYYGHAGRMDELKYNSDNALDGDNNFKDRLIVHHAEGGNVYLYDVLRIKKETS